MFNCLEPEDVVENRFGKRILSDSAILEGHRILASAPDIVGDIPRRRMTLLDIVEGISGDSQGNSAGEGIPLIQAESDQDVTMPETGQDDCSSGFCKDRGYVVREGGRMSVKPETDDHVLWETQRDRVLPRELDAIRSIRGLPDNRCLATGCDLTDSIAPNHMETMGSERQWEYHHLRPVSEGERELPLAKAIVQVIPLGPEAHDKTHRHMRIMKAAGTPVEMTVKSALDWVAPRLREKARDAQIEWMNCVFIYLERICGMSADEARKWILDEKVWPEDVVQAAFELSRAA